MGVGQIVAVSNANPVSLLSACAGDRITVVSQCACIFVVVFSMLFERQKMRTDRKKLLEKQDGCHSQAELRTRKPVLSSHSPANPDT